MSIWFASKRDLSKMCATMMLTLHRLDGAYDDYDGYPHATHLDDRGDVLPTPPTSSRQVRFQDELHPLHGAESSAMMSPDEAPQGYNTLGYGQDANAVFSGFVSDNVDYSQFLPQNQDYGQSPAVTSDLPYLPQHLAPIHTSPEAPDGLFLRRWKWGRPDRVENSELQVGNISGDSFVGVRFFPEETIVRKAADKKPSQLLPTSPLHTASRLQKRKRPEDDPENYRIMKLRTQDHLSWSDIASVMNAARTEQGLEPSYTEAAVYGRFVRNGPKVATATGEQGFDPKDWMHMKKTGTVAGGEGGRRAGRLGTSRWAGKTFTAQENMENGVLEQLVDEVKGEVWDIVAERMERHVGGMWSAERCKKRYNDV